MLNYDDHVGLEDGLHDSELVVLPDKPAVVAARTLTLALVSSTIVSLKSRLICFI